MNALLNNIRWLGYEGFLINKKPIVYINPYKLAFPDVSDLILITDNHPEHCSPDDIKWLRKGATIIIAPEESAARFQGDIRVVRPGDIISEKGAVITVFDASGLRQGNPDENGLVVAYKIAYPDGLTIFHTPNLEVAVGADVGALDVLLFPAKSNGDWLLSEATEFIDRIKPRVAVPMNWDGLKNSLPQIEEIKKTSNTSFEVLKPKP